MPDFSEIPGEAVTAAQEAGNHAYRDGADDATCWRLGLRAALPIVLASRDESDALQVIDERDSAEEWADRLAYAVAPVEVIGEHSSGNNPWQNALNHLASRDSETAELRCAEIEALKAKLNEAYQHIGEQALIDMEEPIPPYGSPERDARVRALRGEQGE